MAIRVEDASGIRLIKLEGVVDIAQSAELKQALLDSIVNSAQVRIFISDAQTMDITIAQLLWAARSEARSVGSDLHIEGLWSNGIEALLSSTGMLHLLTPSCAPTDGEVADGVAARH